jgi:hypothetical protein
VSYHISWLDERMKIRKSLQNQKRQKRFIESVNKMNKTNIVLNIKFDDKISWLSFNQVNWSRKISGGVIFQSKEKCQMNESGTIQKNKRTLFRRRKFDVLIESIYLRVLSTRNCSFFIDEISFSYFFVWTQYFIILWLIYVITVNFIER